MKDQIKKLADGLATAVSLLKEEKTSEAVAALETVADEVVALETAAETAETDAAAKDAAIAEKDAEIEKSAEQIKKYASLYVDGDTLETLMGDLGCVKTMMADVQGIMKSVSTKEDVSGIEARLETIEKASEGRQLREEKREGIEKAAGMIPGLNLNPGA